MNKKVYIIGLLIIIVLGVWAIKANLNSHSLQQITYHDRSYVLTNSSDNLPQNLLDILKEAKPTGEFVNGLEVYVYGNKQTPTGLYLKQKDGKFLVYAISGGL